MFDSNLVKTSSFTKPEGVYEILQYMDNECELMKDVNSKGCEYCREQRRLNDIFFYKKNFLREKKYAAGPASRAPSSAAFSAAANY
jgi:hypothetical protein